MTAPLSSSRRQDFRLETTEAATTGVRALFHGETPDMTVSHSRPIRVMHVTNGMTLGGTEKVVLKLANTLTEGFDHRICCIRDYDTDLIRTHVRLEQLTALRLPESRFALFLPQLVRAIRSCKPDIVHSRNWGAIEAVFAARLAGVPVVIHSEHGYDADGMWAMPFRQRWLRRLACSTADVFFAVSRELRDFHAAQAGIRPDRIRVIYNGVDVHAFSPQPAARARIRAEQGIGPDEFVLGAVGRMVRIKDYQTLLQAAGVLSQQGLNFKLMLVGDGPELPGLISLAESLPGVRERLITLGQRNDVSDLLSAMDVFVQTSLREGMSNTILEAMAAGLPPVVTRVGGNTEIIEEGKSGWLFSAGDVECLSRILHRLAERPESRTSTGQAARRRVHEMFSNERMLSNYRALYLELAARRGVCSTTDGVFTGIQPEGSRMA